MQTDPETGDQLGMGTKELLTYFTDPDRYVPILEAHPSLRLCLAHFGGAGDWATYFEQPWDPSARATPENWLAKTMDMLRSGDHENLYVDISYTLFADDENVHLLKVLIADENVRARVLFGSDFYVVESAKIDERQLSVRARSVLGEDLFRVIAEDNPARYLGET